MNVMLKEPTRHELEPAPPRRTRPRRALLMACVAGITAFVVAYAAFFTPDSPPALTLSSEGGTGVSVPEGVWTVGSGSVAGYRVREKLLRLPASNDAVGRTNAVTGGLQLLTEGDAVLVQSGMRIDVDLASLKSDEQRRDDHMRTMAIETDRFPTATFVTTSDLVVRPDSGSTSARALARGDLTLHGVTRTIEVPVQARYDGSRIEVVGSVSFPWAMFDMDQPNLSYVTVEADPTMEFQLFFDHAGA